MDRLESQQETTTHAAAHAGACGCRVLDLPVSRRFALRRELLIDLDEWCDERALGHALPYPTALTPRLCDIIERIPFRLVNKTTARERARDVVRRALLAFVRAHRAGSDGTDGRCAVIPFAALGSGVGSESWCILQLHCGPGDDGKPAITLGTADERMCEAWGV
jgi:hypothetical protein